METGAAAAKQTLQRSEIELGRKFLEQTRARVIGATDGLSEEQWNFKTDAGRWSIAEIVEHMVIVQERVLGPVMEQLAQSPLASNCDWEQVDGIILHQFTERNMKFMAPEAMCPTGRWTSSEALERLCLNTDSLAGCLEALPDLRQHILEAPPLKAVTQGAYQWMDGYQWVLTVGAHTERHTKQILEIKTGAGFPHN